MKAIIYTKYGSPDVLELKEVEKPAPRDNEVLIKVHATTVTPLDCRFRNGKTLLARLIMAGLIKPKHNILGIELAGEVDAVGKRSFSECKNSLNQKGIYLNTVATIPLILQMLWTSKIGSKKALFMISPYRIEDLIFLRELIEAGKVKSVIDRCYPLSQIVEAHRYVERGHAKGKVVITL